MSLRTADLGSVCARVRSYFGLAQPPQQSHPLSPLHEPLRWRAKRDPKAYMLALQSFLREGRVVGPCWEKLKPKGPKGHSDFGPKAQPPNAAVLRTEITMPRALVLVLLLATGGEGVHGFVPPLLRGFHLRGAPATLHHSSPRQKPALLGEIRMALPVDRGGR